LLVKIIPKAYKSVIGASLLNIPFYTIFTNFNPDSYNPTYNNTHTLRGIAIYAADHLCSSQVFFDADFHEQLWIKINSKRNEYLLVGNIYCTPSNDPYYTTTQVCNLFKEVSKTNPLI